MSSFTRRSRPTGPEEYFRIQVAPDPEPGQAKVVSCRVVGFQDSESRCDLAGGFQIGLLSFGQTEAQADSMHVHVQRNNQFRRGNPVPAAGIDLVATNHPSEKEI